MLCRHSDHDQPQARIAPRGTSVGELGHPDATSGQFGTTAVRLGQHPWAIFGQRDEPTNSDIDDEFIDLDDDGDMGEEATGS